MLFYKKTEALWVKILILKDNFPYFTYNWVLQCTKRFIRNHFLDIYPNIRYYLLVILNTIITTNLFQTQNRRVDLNA
jgi:hypothetical protein